MSQERLETELRRQLLSLLEGRQSHTTFDDAVKDFPADLRGEIPDGLPYSAWQMLEHMRIAQRDILDFSDNADDSYKELKWPDEYWPESAAPPDAHAWDVSVKAYRRDRATFVKLVSEGDLIHTFPWGKGQNLLREALLVADHVAYHLGELVVLRRLLGIWESKK